RRCILPPAAAHFRKLPSRASSVYADLDAHLRFRARKNSATRRSPLAAFAKSPRYRSKSADDRAPVREELENLRGERSNPHWCWQFCAHHNLLRAPPRATLFEEGKSEETSSSAS